MICDFKPGDEVVCVDDGADNFWGPTPLVKGRVYTVSFAHRCTCPLTGPFVGVHLVDAPPTRTGNGWGSHRFRKVQRRDLTAWLATENTIEGPVRDPARKGVSA